jgi:hypothetical protein
MVKKELRTKTWKKWTNWRKCRKCRRLEPIESGEIKTNVKKFVLIFNAHYLKVANVIYSLFSSL